MPTAPPTRRRSFQIGLWLCAAIVVELPIAGCNAKPKSDVTVADDTSVADSVEMIEVIRKNRAARNLPSSGSISIAPRGADEAEATITSATITSSAEPSPATKEILILKKRDGAWTIQSP